MLLGFGSSSVWACLWYQKRVKRRGVMEGLAFRREDCEGVGRPEAAAGEDAMAEEEDAVAP